MTNLLETQNHLKACFDNADLNSGLLSDERVSIYRNLVLATIDDVLTSLYPYTKPFFESNWDEFLALFLASYPPQHYRVFALGESLREFLQENKTPWIHKIVKRNPFLPDLAWYEWREVAIANQKTETINVSDLDVTVAFLDSQKLLSFIPAWNPILAVDTLNYYIPEIIEQLKNKQTLTDIKPAETIVIQYRELNTNRVRFFILNAFTAEVILVSLNQSLTLQEILAHVQQKFNFQQYTVDALLEQALPWLKNCHENGLLLGFRE